MAGDAQIGLHKADQRGKTWPAVGCILPRGGKIGDLIAEASHHGGVALGLRSIEDQAGVRKPGQHPPADDLWPPRELRRPPAAPDPFGGELARNRAVLRLAAVEVSQPSEAVELAGPGWARRLDCERRPPTQAGDSTGEAEAAGCDLVAKAWIVRTQVGRRQQQLVGGGRAIAPKHETRAAHAGQRTPPYPGNGKHRQAQLLARAAPFPLLGRERWRGLRDRCRAALR